MPRCLFHTQLLQAHKEADARARQLLQARGQGPGTRDLAVIKEVNAALAAYQTIACTVYLRCGSYKVDETGTEMVRFCAYGTGR